MAKFQRQKKLITTHTIR